MGNRYEFWAAAAVLAGAALVGCGDAGMMDNPLTGAGGTSGAGGTVAPGAGTGGTAAPAGQGAAGTAGVGTPPPGGSGASGGGGSAGQASPAGGGGGGDGGMGGMSGGAGMSGAGGGGGAMATTGSCGPETTVSAADLGDPMKPGPWTPTREEGTGPNGSSWIFYPEELGMGGLKHPVFQWGPGALTGPSNYIDHLNLLASQGFVIISQPSTQSGREALDWILEQNETSGSMWHEKLDPDRVARGGHSMGALQSFSEADDPRLKLAVLVCGGASGGSGAGDMSYPTIFLGGEGEGGTVNFAGDYAEVTGLSVFVTKTDTGHVPCARNNLAPWVAFMRWQLCGEEKWKAEFMPDGTYCKSPWLACMTKNL
jgi:hypothetical protein